MGNDLTEQLLIVHSHIAMTQTHFEKVSTISHSGVAVVCVVYFISRNCYTNSGKGPSSVNVILYYTVGDVILYLAGSFQH
ncbi:MAG TPA: hypothetical protein VFI73_10110 [Candidatus Nitrosopolaris sp.]|nr:hypothetical protein [Candidatus Nitrosopolaris sp.]